jgi:hypothetical protein
MHETTHVGREFKHVQQSAACFGIVIRSPTRGSKEQPGIQSIFCDVLWLRS